MTEQAGSNVPEIRVKDGSSHWKREPLGAIYTRIRNAFVGTASPYYADNGYFYLQSNNVKNGAINRNTEVFINEEFYLKQRDNWLHTGDIVVVQSGHVGHAAVIPEVLDNTAAHALIIISQPARPTDSEFVNFQFQTQAIKRQIRNITTGNTIQHILASDMRGFELCFCDVKEQIQIATYFQSLDRMIGLHQRKHDKLVTLKQAMLQKMFPQDGAATPEIRFKGFEGEWVDDDFETNVEFFSGLTYSPHHVQAKKGTLVLRSSNVKNGQIVDADNVYVDSSVVDCDQVQVGDIVVVVRNGSRSLIGKHATVKEPMSNTVIGAFMTGLRSKQPGFVNALLSTGSFMKQVNENTGATINQITTGVFKKMRFRFPELEEQRQIGAFFCNLDELISKHTTQLGKLKQIKSACLEKMFV
tara:strand:- start:11071 stop:12312 length:1242 start_codon:yes stop_codon:yes gene_type:complete